MPEDDNLLRAKQVLNRKECEILSDGLASEEKKRVRRTRGFMARNVAVLCPSPLLHCQLGCSFMARNKNLYNLQISIIMEFS